MLAQTAIESIHVEGLLKKGLIVAPHCASCHTPHSILPHTDPASSIARKNIAATCAKCHAQIEVVHRKVNKGELWEKEANRLPACIDCHQPHKVRKVFYTQGMGDKDCMRCHENKDIHASKDGRSLVVHADDLSLSRHSKTACSQCHSEVNASHVRPCETITKKVDCASCHAEIGQQYQVDEGDFGEDFPGSAWERRVETTEFDRVRLVRIVVSWPERGASGSTEFSYYAVSEAP